MKNLLLVVGPPGSGKSTLSKNYENDGYLRISQDVSGRQHLDIFNSAILNGSDVFCDRMNFNKQQRARYLDVAKKYGYSTKIVVLHESYETCFTRCMARQGHETIKDETNARAALNLFFSKYERVSDDEANVVERIWPEGWKPSAIICDLDGTLCEVEHRRHLAQEKNWGEFFRRMTEDTVNQWCADILKGMRVNHSIIYCSGRPDNYKSITQEWLQKYGLDYNDHLFMRHRQDQRQDNIVKENILDFEILTRYAPYFMIDDRQQVVDMWRKRGYTCLQCAPGDF